MLQEEPPIRAELFTREQLEVHAKLIGIRHKISAKFRADQLLRRLQENEQILTEAYAQVTEAVAKGQRISPAGEWLIDNFYLLGEEIRTARRHLPRKYSRQLPQLETGPVAGQPRVYHLALELIAHLDGRIDADGLRDFVAAYQQTMPLQLGELWAVPIMLRLALIEYLRRIAVCLMRDRKERNLACLWAERLLEAAQKEPRTLVLVLADMARANPPLSGAFVSEFSRLLQGKHPAIGLPLTWIEQRLGEQSQNLEELLHQETRRQTAHQISIGNSIASLRLLGAIDWRNFVESLSAVEKTLRGDPAAVYANMDFCTRDRYRHVIEDVAKRSGQTEPAVAAAVLALATLATETFGSGRREGHIGYYLIDAGFPELEAALRARVPMHRRAMRQIEKAPLALYLGLMVLLTGAFTDAFVNSINVTRLPGWVDGLGIIFLVFCTGQLAVAVVNWLATLLIPPRPLPRMDFMKRIPEECRTIVVVPTMLTSEQGITDRLEEMEVRFVANRDPQIYYALLTDFRDAETETTPADERLLTLMARGVERLNEKYAALQAQAFFLLHRPRRWNPRENRWMGYERKRGKLAEFNALLLRAAPERFSARVGDLSLLPSMRFVITLDTDTDLPRDAARLMVATLAHPLVRARYNEVSGMVEEGYGMLQPRLAVSQPSAHKSWFAKTFAGDTGIDPYTRMVSDVYQDVFGEGSFIGKGIYEVAVFDKILRDRFPENRILSHDLLEGCYVRTGLVSDVYLYEDHPSHYGVEMARRHRWIRGDWQIASWLGRRAPAAQGGSEQNPLSGLSRWKILDNLRRSLVPACLVGLFMVTWLSIPAPSQEMLMVLELMVFPVFLATCLEALRKQADSTLYFHLRTVGWHLLRQLGQFGCNLAFLPYEACVNLDAIGRTIWRLAFSHRHLLEWQTANDAHRGARQELSSFLGVMGIAPMLAALFAALLWVKQPASLDVAAPLLGLWALSPVVACWISRPLQEKKRELTQAQQDLLRRTARRTWAYFDALMGPEDNYLPPDNFQEYPEPMTAHRTSPTNLGMGLIAFLGAYDFGYIGAGTLVARLNQTMATLQKLERFRGHFYNWYDTRTLEPLPVPYVSTVDSGNLVALLLTLRQGLLELRDHPLLPPRAHEGLRDGLLVIQEHWPAGGTSIGHERAKEQMQQLITDLEHPPESVLIFQQLLQRLRMTAAALSLELPAVANEELKWAVKAFTTQCEDLERNLGELAPWLSVAALSPKRLGVSARRAGKWEVLEERLRSWGLNFRVGQVVQAEQLFVAAIDDLLNLGDPASILSPAEEQWLVLLRAAVAEGAERARAQIKALETLAASCQELAQADFGFLYDETRKQMAIGYSVGDRRRDASFYDLLASEARLASFVAIAQGQLPQEHWFALGRRLTEVNGEPVLFSWSGSMFEYLMPMLIMPTYANTLLDRTCQMAVMRQIQYGRERGVPWGISESGYNATDAQLNYLYRSFGVPGLGFKRGLADDLVITPYASVMALMVDAPGGGRNLERLAVDGMLGHYGYYEAVDYTPTRVPPGESRAIVHSFMTHHQGMNLLALEKILLGPRMQHRFLQDPIFRATEVLLQERIPDTVRIALPPGDAAPTPARLVAVESPTRMYTVANTPTPEVQLLSNARYHVMISSSGGGYSRWGDLAVTRWREDPTRECWGSFCYVRDLESGVYWSATHQPTLKLAESYHVNFQQARAEFRRREMDITTYTEISVAPEDDVEVRRITLTNHGRERRIIELTSYAEVVLASPAADAAHPAFSNLFVETEILRARRAILCTRRPRSSTDAPVWMMHLLAVSHGNSDEATFETDRGKFIGRGHSLEAPMAMQQVHLSDTQGAVLDPIVSIRQSMVVEPDEVVRISLITGMAKSRAGALELIEKYHDLHLAERVFAMAHTHSQLVRRQLNATAVEADLFAHMAGAIIYPSRGQRATAAILAKNRRPQSALWSYGISGDLPIVLVRIGDQANIELVRRAIQAHAYWRLKGLAVDLVIWNEGPSGYRQVLHDLIMGLVEASPETHVLDRPGGIFVRRMEQISPDDQVLFQTVARLTITDTAGTLLEQVDRPPSPVPEMAKLIPTRRRAIDAPDPGSPAEEMKRLLMFNGLGGFTPDGKEYIILTQGEHLPPAPWVNVIANAKIGTVVSECGSLYTWVENAHEYRLTPWANDAVTDTSGEAFYIRDEESGNFWSPTPLPAHGGTPYRTRHGMGYTIFEHREQGVRSELCIYVAPDAPVKFAVLKIFNESGRTRRLSATGYWEWTLGELRSKSLMHVVTETDPNTQAIFARNAYNSDFSGHVAFVEANEPTRSLTGDRTEFLGRNGTLANPAALRRTRLSGRLGAGLDACAALQVPFELADQDQRELVFILGAGQNLNEARDLMQRHRTVQAAREALEGIWSKWNQILGQVQIETSDPTVDLLANVWLPYQIMTCRLWGRSGFYQSGGAFGFRDQLQDAMALVHHAPGLLREHLLRCAGRQFIEGDVQHWWHPPTGRGVRTHISDDFLWLPLAACRYVNITADTGVLNEKVQYLEGRALPGTEEAYYDQPVRSEATSTLYEHCVKAVEHGLRFGVHGLPLMGTGDWNDGMNRVGKDGQGESVWLAFFLHEVLKQFSELAEQRGDVTFAHRCQMEAEKLRENIERHAWDGQWYRRAYFDNGEPLGSVNNLECQIDSLPQSWAVLSGVGDPERRRQAMAAVAARLVQREAKLIQLFTPPLDKSPQDPGYIKGYVPGVRENGGQYTHAAVWTTMAFAAMGDHDRAWELFALINPLRHGLSPEKVATYKVEPYVVAADVYAMPPHTGRGGWTWYTGSAGWMYRLILESLLGVERRGDLLTFMPRLSRDGNGFKLHYRYRRALYHFNVSLIEKGGAEIELNGVVQPGRAIRLVDEPMEHHVNVRWPRA